MAGYFCDVCGHKDTGHENRPRTQIGCVFFWGPCYIPLTDDQDCSCPRYMPSIAETEERHVRAQAVYGDHGCQSAAEIKAAQARARAEIDIKITAGAYATLDDLLAEFD